MIATDLTGAIVELLLLLLSNAYLQRGWDETVKEVEYLYPLQTGLFV